MSSSYAEERRQTSALVRQSDSIDILSSAAGLADSDTNLSQIVTFIMVSLVILLPWLTLVVSQICLALYRRTVVRSMRDALPTPAPLIEKASTAVSEPRPVDLHVQAADEPASGWPTGGALYDEWRRATRDTTKVYVAAGIVYALVMAAAYVFRLRISAVTMPALLLAFVWPTVLTALLVAVPARGRQTQVVVGYWILFFIAAAVCGLEAEKGVWLVSANVIATIMAVVVRARRIRAVAPLVGAFLMLLGIAIATFFGFLAMIGLRPAAELTTGEGIVLVLLLLVLPVAAPMAGWRVLRRIGRWYADKRTSDETLTMAAIWIIFAGVHGATIAYDDLQWMSVGLVAFVGFLLVTSAGFRILRRRGFGLTAAPRLLVLRVFALGQRSRRLFDRLTARWRHVGSVQLIAGPDLASSTVEPHEFFDFLSRRLARRFLENAQSIDTAIAALDTRPDNDCRYRITDFFCRDSVWQTMFARLTADSDVVLMDLRGFSSGNCGCTYELTQLLNLVPLGRVAIVIDGSTDQPFLTRTIEEAAARVSPSSPNAAGQSLRVHVFRETDRRGLDPDRLLRLLCDRAAQATRYAVGSNRIT